MPDDWVRTPAQQAAIHLLATIDARQPIAQQYIPGSPSMAGVALFGLLASWGQCTSIVAVMPKWTWQT